MKKKAVFPYITGIVLFFIGLGNLTISLNADKYFGALVIGTLFMFVGSLMIRKSKISGKLKKLN
jgi:uncharacterized membrane protein YiaA